MSDRGSMQGPRDWHSDRGSGGNSGGRRWHEEGNGRERRHGDEWRRDGPEQYREWRERDDSRGSGPRGPYGGRNSERSYGNGHWCGGGSQRPYSRGEQREILPYGSPRNTQHREGGDRYGSSSGGGYGSSGDNPRREYPGALQHVKQDTRPSEQQRAEEERRARVARELQRIREEEEAAFEERVKQEARELQQIKKRKEEEEYAAYMYEERVKQVRAAEARGRAA